MERRDFIKKSAAAGITGSSVINGLYFNGLFENSTEMVGNIDIPRPLMDKLVIKPIITGMYHTAEWEGPCRFNVKSMEEEKNAALQSFDRFGKTIKENKFDLSTVEILEPDQILFTEDFKIKEDQYSKIEEDAKRADVLYISPGGSSIATYEIAKRYEKPVIINGLSCRTVDVSAYCRSKGVECFVPTSVEETNQLFTLLKARKNFSHTRVLYPTDWGWPAVASVAGINEPEKLKEQFGIEVVRITYAELSEEVDKVKMNKGLTKNAGEMAEDIYKNADHSFIDKKYVGSSMQFYQAIAGLMKKHNCNAFTIECFEFCCSRLPQKWNITPCLIHTMFKDSGIVSACEGDLGGLLSMQMLMSLSNKSPHFGNMFYQQKGAGVLTVNHSVPGIKMNGFNKPGLPYQLAHFVESGWGTKVVVDFMNNDTKEVTVARMNPTGTGLLVLKGTLVGSEGWGEDICGCAVSAYIVGKDSGTAEEFVRKQTDYGNHLAWVYGDYSDQLKKMGEMIGVEVVVVS